MGDIATHILAEGAFPFHQPTAPLNQSSTGYASEQYRLGGPHWHGLLAAGTIHRDDVATLEEEWKGYHGYARLERPRNCAPSPGSRGETTGDDVPTCPLSVEDFCAKYLWKPEGTLVLHGFSDAAVRSFRAVLEDLIWVDESL
jgi:hypothetical protein